MSNAYFTVWRDPKTRKWRFTLYTSNGRQLVHSTTHYSSKASARKGCDALMYCFSNGHTLPVHDGLSQ